MKLIILLLFLSCGKLDVRTKPVEINHNHNFNIDGLFEFCESIGGTNEEVEQCKRDALAAIANAGRQPE